MTRAEFYEFMREQTLRHERASREMQRGLQALERRTDAEVEALRELIEESRAQRQALFRMIDRLDRGGAAGGPEPATG